MISRVLKNPGFIAAAGVLVASALGMSAAIRLGELQLNKVEIHAPGGRLFSSLPMETANWVRAPGTSDRRETKEVEEELGTKNYLSRVYVQKNPPEGKRPIEIDLHCAYYTGMVDTVPHVPDRCFVAGGMEVSRNPQFLPLNLDRSDWIEDASVPEHLRGHVFTSRTSYEHSDFPGQRIRLPYDPGDIGLRVTEFTFGDESHKLIAGYFFIANGGTTPSAEGVRLLAFDLRTKYAYYAKVQVTSSNAASAEELRDAASSLLSELMPEIMRCVPDWVEVEAGRYPESTSNAS
ncbi:MAG: hypothetical protein RBS39_06955 [Phycisphaerales bacterium]|jgi:hypothetical protein|nr:hypothetical protein [Phycisphaerales bacterium]